MKPSEVVKKEIRQQEERLNPDPIRTIILLTSINLIKSIEEMIINHPKTFGITDRKGRGGAILVEDVIASLEAEKELIKNKMI